jgi:hypothetical protein
LFLNKEYVAYIFGVESSCYLLHAGFLLRVVFYVEDEGEMFLRNIGYISTDYTALYPPPLEPQILYVTFRFTGNQPRTEKLLNAKYEHNPSSRPGTSEAHIHTNRWHSENHSFVFGSAENV